VTLIDIHEDAKRECREAIAWYEDASAGLRSAFRLDFDAAVQRIISNPGLFAKEGVYISRICPFNKCSYLIQFFIRGDTSISIITIAHSSRIPGFCAYHLGR